MTKQSEIKQEINKLIDNCYTKGSPDYPWLVFQPQKFLNDLFPLLDRLGVVVKVEDQTILLEMLADGKGTGLKVPYHLENLGKNIVAIEPLVEEE